MAFVNAQQPRILIVGGGPSGLILALTLRRNGVPVRVIEKSTENRKGQRGAGITPRTLELFETLGIYDEVVSRAITRTVVLRMYKMPDGVEILKEFEPSPREEPTPSIPYNNMNLLGQDNLDKILRAQLAKSGCEVELGVELQYFEQFEDNVKVTLLKHDTTGNIDAVEPITEEASYEWIIGADGAKGVVRKLLGLKLLGETITNRFVVGDAKIEGLAPDRFHIWGDMADIMTLIRGTEDEGVFNFFIGGAKLENPEEICVNDESLRDAIKKHIGLREDVKIGEFSWVSPYRVNIRMTEVFQKGRVFLTGDAAHVHSPAGGQGMNTGVQDSYNLGWKLALVSKGLSSPSLLDTFNEERVPVVAQMLKISTALLKKTLANTQDEESWNRSGDIKQLGVNYRWSSIVIDDEKKRDGAQGALESTYNVGNGVVRAGDRAPDASGLMKVGYLSDGTGPEIRLFKLFSPARHTVLIFASKTDYQMVLHILQTWPGDLVQSVVITQAGKGIEITAGDQSKTIVAEDRDGHAHIAYNGPDDTSGIFIIRPDGVIGARLGKVEGINHYFQTIFIKSH